MKVGGGGDSAENNCYMLEMWNKPNTNLPPSIPKTFVFTITKMSVFTITKMSCRDLVRWKQISFKNFINYGNFLPDSMLTYGILLKSFPNIYCQWPENYLYWLVFHSLAVHFKMVFHSLTVHFIKTFQQGTIAKQYVGPKILFMAEMFGRNLFLFDKIAEPCFCDCEHKCLRDRWK